jgi:ribosomal protein L15E
VIDRAVATEATRGAFTVRARIARGDERRERDQGAGEESGRASSAGASARRRSRARAA